MGDTPSTPTMSIKNAVKLVLIRDLFKCQLCRLPCFPCIENANYAPSVDHIIEARNNGRLSLENIRLAHRFCNSAREAYPDPCQHPKFKRAVEFPIRDLLNKADCDIMGNAKNTATPS